MTTKEKAKIDRFLSQHDYEYHINGTYISVHIPWFNFKQGTQGTEIIPIHNFKHCREVLGY